MIGPLTMFGLPVTLSMDTLVKHVARRRAACGRIRSRREWIDGIRPSPIAPSEMFRVGNQLICGPIAYAQLLEGTP